MKVQFRSFLTPALLIISIFTLPIRMNDNPNRIDRQNPAGNDLVRLKTEPLAKKSMSRQFEQMPLYFIENQGQVDPRVSFYIQGRDKMIFFTPQGLTFGLVDEGQQQPGFKQASFQPDSARKETEKKRTWVVKLDFLGANPQAMPVGMDQTEALFSYFKGSEDQWRRGVRSYASIVYKDLWPGIDLEYSGTTNRMKYQFVVRPGADPHQIRLAYRGASDVAINEGGQLEVSTPFGGFQDEKPYSFQEMDNQKIEVKTRYRLEGEPGSEGQKYGFDVGKYDASKPLILDPSVLIYCGFIGGSASETIEGIAVDSSGNAYVTGSTSSSELGGFPVLTGPDTTFNGQTDAFVAKVKSDGTGLVYCGFIGGSGCSTGFTEGKNGGNVNFTDAVCDTVGGYDFGRDIAVDSSGNVYIIGITSSIFSNTFPRKVGPDLTYNDTLVCNPFFGCNPGQDVFVAKVNPAGTNLIYCGYVGGNKYDYGEDIAVDANGNAYITGYTESSESQGFPVTIGPDLTVNGLINNPFVAKIKADGTGLVYCGYIGGGGAGNGIAVDNQGNAYIAGSTSYVEANFPVTVGPDLTNNGGSDAFVAKVKADGTGLAYCGYVGGSNGDYGKDIAIDSSGNAYLIGGTLSDETTFPVLVGPDLTHNGGSDVFVTKIKADGTGLIYSGYVGGQAYDDGFGIAVDGGGNAYITGATYSNQSTFPVIGGPDITYNDTVSNNSDVFVARIMASGAGLLYCGYIGGDGLDQGNAIAVDSNGNAYIAGYTWSGEATFPVVVGPDLTHDISSDAFVAKIPLITCAFSIAPGAQTFPVTGGNGTVDVTTTSNCGWVAVSNAPWITINSGQSGSGSGQVGFSVAANTGTARSGTMTIAGQTFTVMQDCEMITIVTQPADQTACPGGAVSFNAAGSVILPFTIQWQVSTDGGANYANISGATSETLTLSNLTSSMSGRRYRAVFSNGCGTVMSDAAILNVEQFTLTPGNNIVPAGGGNGSVNVGTTSSCSWMAVSNAPWIMIDSGNSGMGNGVVQYSVQVNAGAVRIGTISIAGLTFTVSQEGISYEADVAPRPIGSGAVVVSDWVQIGRFSVGLDTPAPGSEFQRADCAPRNTLGDGKITVADWVQAGRYSVGLDPITEIGGPGTPAIMPLGEQLAITSDPQGRMVRAVNAVFTRGRIGTLEIEFDALGDENALAFSISYDPRQAVFLDAEDPTSGATLVVNERQASKGHIAIAMAMPAGKVFSSGRQRFLRLRFIPTGGEGSSSMEVRFDDSLIERGLATPEASLLPRPDFQPAMISIEGNSPAVVSAASYESGIVGADSIATVFGKDLAVQTESAWTLPLPRMLAGSRVTVTDSDGVPREAPLFYVSSGQINFLVPEESARGPATVSIASASGAISIGLINIVDVAPGLFTAGDGTAAAGLIPGSDGQFYLALYGTGWRHLKEYGKIEILIDGSEAVVTYAGVQRIFAGLDQINVLLPRTIGEEVRIEIRIDGIPVSLARFRSLKRN